MSDNNKYYSDLEKYEIINISDGEKYSYLSNNDVVIDEEGNLKFLVIYTNKSKFNFFNSNDFIEIPWEYVNKIGTNIIVVDVDEKDLKKAKL